MDLLKRGFKNNYIRKKLNITPYDFDIFIRDIKAKKIMTSQEINVAKERKRQEDVIFVADCVNNGLTSKEIRELKPEFSYNEITPMLKELIEKGIITQEKIDKNARNAGIKTLNRNVQLSPEEQIQFIENKVREGYAPKEIVESDETKSLSMHKVLYQKRQLIAKGIISKEEADNAMKKRQEKLLEEKRQKA